MHWAVLFDCAIIDLDGDKILERFYQNELVKREFKMIVSFCFILILKNFSLVITDISYNI